MFKIKTEYKLQILTNETMALFGDGPIVDQDENGVNVPELEQVHSVLLHCNVVIYRKQIIIYFCSKQCFWTITFYPIGSINTIQNNYSIFDHIEIWFTDQNNNSLQLEDSVSVTH